MNEDTARRRLSEARVGRLATITPAGRPHTVPCCFALDGDRIVSAVDAKPKSTLALARLANLRAHPEVALLVDHYEEDWAALWWVRADGAAAIIDDPAEMTGPLRLLAGRYRQYQASPPAGPVIAIAVTRWTGWSAS